MAGFKLSAKATETVEYLEHVLKETDHFGALVEQFAATQKGGDMYATQLARELGQLRQKAMTRNLGYLADQAGQLGVMASRGGSAMMKSRILRDGVLAFKGLVERTIKATIAADENEQKEKEFLAEKERKTQAEHIRARVLAEEARQAAKEAAGSAPAAAPAGGAAATRPAAPPSAAPGAPRPAVTRPAAPVPGARPTAPQARPSGTGPAAPRAPTPGAVRPVAPARPGPPPPAPAAKPAEGETGERKGEK